MSKVTITALTCDCDILGIECQHSHKREAFRTNRQAYLECENESATRCECGDCGSDIAVSMARWVTRWTITIPLCQDCYTRGGRESEHRREHYPVTHKWHPV